MFKIVIAVLITAASVVPSPALARSGDSKSGKVTSTNTTPVVKSSISITKKTDKASTKFYDNAIQTAVSKTKKKPDPKIDVDGVKGESSDDRHSGTLE